MKPKKVKNNNLTDDQVLNLLKQHQTGRNNIIKEFELLIKNEMNNFQMVNKILKHKNDVICPTEKLININLKLNTWFTIKESLPENFDFTQYNYTIEEKEEIKYNCKRIELDLTEKQKQIINIWLNAYREMYNESLKYIKENLEFDKKVLYFFYLRNILKKKKEELVEKSNIKVHDIDYAIKLACQNYKSGLENYKKGYIKHFRVRYWRKEKKIKIMDLEKLNFKNNSIRKKVLGDVKGYYNGKRYNFDLIETDCRLQKNEGRYYLFVPNFIVMDKKEKRNKQITIDPGLRCFGTGITENKIVKINENNKKIKDCLIRKDNIMKNEKIDIKIKKKNEKKINKKIENLVNELHWKTINYLTENYETVLIGNMSSKNIVCKGGNLNKLNKRLALHLKFYKFHERLKYKCDMKGVNYGKINEWLTSKMCSICGNIKENLGGSEIYECEKCKVLMERDVNGARNIYIRAIKE